MKSLTVLGARPQFIKDAAVTRECFEKDFEIQDESYHVIPNLWNLLGIEFPGLSASLALAEHVFSLTGV